MPTFVILNHLALSMILLIFLKTNLGAISPPSFHGGNMELHDPSIQDAIVSVISFIIGLLFKKKK